jgi:kanamycin kinase
MRHLAELRSRYADRIWTRVDYIGSGADVWRLGGRRDLFVKVGDPSVAREADRFVWLETQGIPTAEVVEAGTDGDRSWLVTVAVPGRPASGPWPEADLDAVVDAIADVTRRLHALRIDDCPFDRSLRHSIADARRAAARHEVDLDDLDDERVGVTAVQLLAQLEATRPLTEDLVVCHGDLCLPNVIVDPHTQDVTGLIDVGRLGVADRYADLALMERSLGRDSRNDQFGPVRADRFLAAADGERQPDQSKLAFYRLLDEFF